MKNQIKRLDKLASKLCLLINPNCCVCGKPAHEPHHLFKRRIIRLRWDFRNLFSVCRTCHQRVELASRNDELKLLRIPASYYETLRQESLKINKGLDALDLDEIEADLKQRIKMLSN